MSNSSPQAEIFIVDDQVHNLQVLSTLLSHTGYRVRKATSGALALKSIQTSLPDLVLLDIQMPCMDGYEVCLQLKADDCTRDIPVIFLSALDDVPDKVRAFQVGGVDYITKPFRNAEVLARVQTHLNLRYLQQQLQLKNALLEQEIRDRQAAEAALAAANLELQRLARSDGLTQLANRRFLNEFLEREWGRLLRHQQPLSLILLDIDFFKLYNDTYGHLAGDQCLRQVASLLQTTVRRPSDLVARYGGEEFVIVLPQTPMAGAIEVATILRQKIHALQLPHKGSPISPWVTLSLGIASTIPTSKTSWTELLNWADQALYQAKQAGRDRLMVFESGVRMPELPSACGRQSTVGSGPEGSSELSRP